MAGDAERPPVRVTLVPRLEAQLRLLLERLQAAGVPDEAVGPLTTTANGALAKIHVAEQGGTGVAWVAALRQAQNCRPLLADLRRAAQGARRAGPRHLDPALSTEMLAAWVITQAELYCKVQIIHLGLALSDPDDVDDNDDVETLDFTGHVGEELIRQIGVAEREVLKLWPQDRYRLYRLIHTNYSRLRDYTGRRGWREETDALDYMMRVAHMRGLHHYVLGRAPRPPANGGDGSRPTPVRDRGAVLGRLLIDRFYWFTAGFGYRPLRALGINIAVVVLFALVYSQFHLLCVFYTNGGTVPAQQCQDVSFPQTLYFSMLAFFLAAMGEILPRPLWGQALLVLESIWGFLNVSVIIAIIIGRQSK